MKEVVLFVGAQKFAPIIRMQPLERIPEVLLLRAPELPGKNIVEQPFK